MKRDWSNLMNHEYDVEVEADQPGATMHEPVFSSLQEIETRIGRLAGAYGFARATVCNMSARYQNAFEGAVIMMVDAKGTLQVYWRDHESRVLFEGVIAGAWENSGESMVLHKLVDKR